MKHIHQGVLPSDIVLFLFIVFHCIVPFAIAYLATVINIFATK